MKRFFGQPEFEEKKGFYIGEMATTYSDAPTMGFYTKGAAVVYRELASDQNQIVYAIDYRKDGETSNWYAYLRPDGDQWKLSAVRSLVLPGVFYMALEQAKAKPNLSPSEQWEIEIMELTAASDSQLKQHLRDNEAALKALTNIAFDDQALIQASNEEPKTAAARLYELHLSYAEPYSKIHGAIQFTIGGMRDDKVGYLFIPEGKEPPPMDPSNFIYIEEVLPNWYLFKTT